MNVNEGLEDIKAAPWSTGGKHARGVLRYCLKPDKGFFFFFCHWRVIDTVLSRGFYTTAPKCVIIRRLAGTRHVSPVVL